MAGDARSVACLVPVILNVLLVQSQSVSASGEIPIVVVSHTVLKTSGEVYADYVRMGL